MKDLRLFLFTAILSALLAVLVAVTPGVDSDSESPDLSGYPFLYLREGKALVPEEQLVELIAVGDIMLGRGVAGAPGALEAVAPWLQAADLALGNLESALALPGKATPAPTGDSTPGPYYLVAPPSAARSLRQGGFDLLGLANNHALDLGPTGLAETVDKLHAVNIQAIGVGPNPSSSPQPIFRRVKEARLAFLAFNAVPPADDNLSGWSPSLWDPEGAAAAIRQARLQADVVIIFIHWGYEYETHTAPAQRQAAQLMLAAGADLVLGHHPHVVQGTEVFPRSDQGLLTGDQFVAYSLGNFVFDQFQDNTRQGLALRILLDRHGLRAVQALPVWAGPRPRLMALDEATSLLERIAPPPLLLGFTCDEETCQPTTDPQETHSGLFWSGWIDLTGDGILEQVIRRGEGVIIFQDGVTAWHSPPEWQVLDLALGDPNDDGRGELMLALRKPDGDGKFRSHPFIVGYRGGTYRLLWGGSAVSDPILEVELGDLDGDGVEDLVVLEEQGVTGQSAVTVWRWHGWGFSQLWRSQAGYFRDVVVIPATEGTPSMISVASPWQRTGLDVR